MNNQQPTNLPRSPFHKDAENDKEHGDLKPAPRLEVAHEFGDNAQMKRQFGTIATLGIAFVILNSWVAEAGSLLAPLALGGPVTILWGCVAGAVFTSIICVGIAELASALPSAGGPYHYTHVVATESTRRFLLGLQQSFFVGWSNVIAWWFIISSAALFMASFIVGMVVLNNPNYIPTAWQVWLVYTAIVVVATIIVVGGNNIMSLLTSASLYWSLASFLVCLVTTIAMHRGQPYQPASFVFGNFSNYSGWSNNGIAFVIGWMLSSYSFLGIDAATHLSEEMPRPEVDVPRAMAGAIITGLVSAFAFLLALLFCVTSFDEIVSSPTGVPVLAIFYQATTSKAAATALTCLIFVSIFFSEISGILVAGRTTWAFARDNGMPFSKILSQVDERSGMPLNATLLSSFLAIAYGAIYIGSPTAFSSMMGSSIVMLFSTYAIPQAILAIRGRQSLPPRPFDLGKLGRVFNTLAPIFVIFSTVVNSFPPLVPVSLKSMNYLSVIVMGCWVLITGFYFTAKRGLYHGPILLSE